MNRMERNIIDSIHQCLIFGIGGCVTAVALERKVAPTMFVSLKGKLEDIDENYCASFSSTYLE